MDPFGDQRCRLCFTESSVISIYDDVEEKILEKICKHIGEVSKTDLLPKFICLECFNKISTFHEFYCGVHVAQENFLRNLVKDEPSSFVAGHFANSYEATTADYSVDSSNVQDDQDHIGIGAGVNPSNEFPSFPMHYDVNEDEVEYIERIKEESIEIDDIAVKEEESESYSVDEYDYVKKPKYDKLDKGTIVAGISQYFDHTCDYCPAELKSLNRAINHYKTEHNTSGYLKCCNLKFSKPDLVEDHVRWHRNPKVFQRDYCPRSMKTRLSLSTHHAKHRNLKKITCDICNRTFRDMAKLKQHMNTHAKQILKETPPIHEDDDHTSAINNKKMFKCTKCSNKYTRRVNLNKHEWIHHAPMKPNYQCSSCASTCTTSYNIRVHMRDFHGINIDPAAAKALNKPVASRSVKTKKRVIRKALTCEECGIVCHGIFNLNRHLKIHKRNN